MAVQVRDICEIAEEIKADWTKPHFAAMPYLNAMDSLFTINDYYYCDSAREIILRFLANARTWRGPIAQKIKKELKAIAGVI